MVNSYLETKVHCNPLIHKLSIIEINTQKGQLRHLAWLLLGSSKGGRMSTDHCFSLRAFSWQFLGQQEIKPVSPQGTQTLNIHWKDWWWSSIPWPPDAKSWLTGKDSDVGKDWEQEEKGVTEDKMVGQHPRLSEHEFEQTPGDNGQGSLASSSSWGRNELDMT